MKYNSMNKEIVDPIANTLRYYKIKYANTLAQKKDELLRLRDIASELSEFLESVLDWLSFRSLFFRLQKPPSKKYMFGSNWDILWGTTLLGRKMI